MIQNLFFFERTSTCGSFLSTRQDLHWLHRPTALHQAFHCWQGFQRLTKPSKEPLLNVSKNSHFSQFLHTHTPFWWFLLNRLFFVLLLCRLLCSVIKKRCRHWNWKKWKIQENHAAWPGQKKGVNFTLSSTLLFDEQPFNIEDENFTSKKSTPNTIRFRRGKSTPNMFNFQSSGSEPWRFDKEICGNFGRILYGIIWEVSVKWRDKAFKRIIFLVSFAIKHGTNLEETSFL